MPYLLHQSGQSHQAHARGASNDVSVRDSGVRTRGRRIAVVHCLAVWLRGIVRPIESRGRMAAAPLSITIEHLESFAIGAWIMGAGGGGEPYFSLLEARKHWAEGRKVEL